jgi:phage-related protein
MGSGLWEVGTDLEHGRIARVFFVVDEGELVALHGFIKRTRATPPAELELARKRQMEVLSWRKTRTTDRR